MMKLVISLTISITMLLTSILSKYQKVEHNSDDFINLKVNRTVSLMENIVEITTEILIRNNQVDPADTYRLPILRNNSGNLLFIEAQMSSTDQGDDSLITLKTHKQHASNPDFIFYDLSFRKEPMNNQEERILKIKEYYQNQYDLLPKTIYLTEDQFSVFTGNYNYLSFYETTEQKTRFYLPNTSEKVKILDYTKTDASLDENKIIYFLAEPVEPMKVHWTRIHYECNTPLYQFNTAERIVEVSHWGNIAVEEKYQIFNIGAKHIGEFGRVDFKKGKGGKNTLELIEARLPLRSNNLWYRDEIGNVSTSLAEREWDNVKLGLEFRFPLMGGWKNDFNIGYNLPSKFNIENNESGEYKLRVNFGIPFHQALAKSYTIKIILPEKAISSKIDIPFTDNYKVTYETYYSILDSIGRQMIVITMNNVFHIHNTPIEVSY